MTTLTEGAKAPAFKGKDQDGNMVSLADFKGKKIVLYFYPEDDTPTCTVQACNLRDNFSLLKQNGFTVIGISPDDEKSHEKFREKMNIPFLLASDKNHQISQKYGVYGLKKFMGKETMGVNRTTFLIDKDGKIEKIFHKVKPNGHSIEVLNYILKSN